MKIVENSISREEWNRFLVSEKSSTIYHTPEWKDFLEHTFNYEPRYLFAKNDNDELIGMMPFFIMKGLSKKGRLVSLPFSHVCYSLGSNEVIEVLFRNAQKMINSGIKAIEIRSTERMAECYANLDYSTYILKLAPKASDVWNGLDRGSVRWAINKSKNYGVTVETSDDVEALYGFFELNCLTKKAIGVPGHPLIFFKNLFVHVKPYVKLYTVRLDGKIIAGGIMEEFNDRIIYGYGAADPNYLKVHPYHAFIWKSIEEACNAGYGFFDFGRTSKDNKGLIQFKKRWNAQEIQLYYNNYPFKTNKIDRESLVYRIGNKMIRRSPMAAYKFMSRVVFPSLG